jgi:hypothetical protein
MTSVEYRNNPLFLRNQFIGVGVFEMPQLKTQKLELDNFQLLGYDKTRPDDGTNSSKYIHFFLDDYKFEALWNNPEPRLAKLRQYRGLLTPQFSTYTEMPVPLQLYNTFRSRWVGAWYQANGLKVIPTLYWGDPQSYWYCFDGVEKGSVVAISMIGIKREKDFFLRGYKEMLKRIEPRRVICYVEPFEEMEGRIIKVSYAETNHLAPPQPQKSAGDMYIKRFIGYVDSALRPSPPRPARFDGELYIKTFYGFVDSPSTDEAFRNKGYGSAGGGGGRSGRRASSNRIYSTSDPNVVTFKGSEVWVDKDSFDLNYISPRANDRSNLELIREGNAPFTRDNAYVILHHVNQTMQGSLRAMSGQIHSRDTAILHHNTGQSPSQINRSVARGFRGSFWKAYAEYIEEMEYYNE